MKLRVETGITVKSPDFINDAYEIDKSVYEEQYIGKIDNMVKRYNACKDSFILIYDGDKLVGYMNFFPVSNDLAEKMLDEDDTRMYDDDILPPDIQDWSSDKPNDIFILSIAVLEEYRKSEAVVLLGDKFLEFLREKSSKGYKFNSISGFTVSLGGIKFLKRLRATRYKDVKGGTHYFYTTEENTELLIEQGLNFYKKTYKDDLYFLIPMTAKGKISDEFNTLKNRCDKSQNEFCSVYSDAFEEHVEYECDSECFKSGNVSRTYVGEFTFLCLDDDYDSDGNDIILNKEKAHIFITAHEKTNIYVVTVAIPNNTYNPSQLIDQMSSGHLEILIDGRYTRISEYMETRFNLQVCGETKCVICMSDYPENKMELPYLLSGETMVSNHINYKIRPDRMADLTKCRSVYDYYDSYISRSVIAFIFKRYSDDLETRISTEVSVLFIVEIVLFQNTAVLRTNRNVIKELSEHDGISNQEIEELYAEFGKTMEFWSNDIYKYPCSQLEANEVIKSFGISEALDDYHRNQRFLDRLIELKGKINEEKAHISEEKANTKMNNSLFILTIIQGGSIIVPAFLWEIKFFSPIEITGWCDNLIRIIITFLVFAGFFAYQYLVFDIAKVKLHNRVHSQKKSKKNSKKEE